MGETEHSAAGSAGSRGEPAGEAASRGLVCDFCGEEVPRVRRVALDRGYERLQTPHPVRYACSSCSDKKEQDRLVPARG